MAGDGNGAPTSHKKGKQKYLPHNKPVRKGTYPLRPGVEGFFITCDGGRERQAANEAINLVDTFYEELVHGEIPATKATLPSKPLNKIMKFSDSDSSESEDDTHEMNGSNTQDQAPEGNVDNKEGDKNQPNGMATNDSKTQDQAPEGNVDNKEGDKNQPNGMAANDKSHENEEPPAKKLCLEPCQEKFLSSSGNAKVLSIDKQIEAELDELSDWNKRHFVSLDSGCNGCIFIQMNKRAGDPSPTTIVQHMMKSAASTRKHMSRFTLRVLPVEIACYASEEEITRAIKPLISQYFPAGAQALQKFAVLYEARANTGIDRMKIINAVAKSVPQPHKVDLSNPDKTIVVQIVKTICLVAVIEGYKQLAKYNLRQLTAPKQ